MVELRSGTNTGGQNPSTSDGRDPNIPENIEVAEQADQTANQGAQMQNPSNQQEQPPVAAQGVRASEYHQVSSYCRLPLIVASIKSLMTGTK